MTISKQMGDREYQKFREAGDGLPAIAVVNPDGSSISGGSGTTSTTTQVGDSATTVTLKEANTSRVKLVVTNNSTATLYVKEGTNATASDWSYRLEQYDTAIIDDYTGVVTGVWASDAGGVANATETS